MQRASSSESVLYMDANELHTQEQCKPPGAGRRQLAQESAPTYGRPRVLSAGPEAGSAQQTAPSFQASGSSGQSPRGWAQRAIEGEPQRHVLSPAAWREDRAAGHKRRVVSHQPAAGTLGGSSRGRGRGTHRENQSWARAAEGGSCTRPPSPGLAAPLRHCPPCCEEGGWLVFSLKKELMFQEREFVLCEQGLK